MVDEPLFSCQNGECACEYSYPAGDLRLWQGRPICENCFDGEIWAGNVPIGEDDPPSYTELPPFVPAYAKQIEALKEALTPSGHTKAAYIGEFHFHIEEQGEDEMCPVTRKIAVPWTTIKEIMAAISTRAARKDQSCPNTQSM